MAYEWQSDIIRPDSENPGTEVLDGNGVVQPQIEGGDNITIANGRINASGTLEHVQADFAETDPTAPSYIQHKPDLSVYATTSEMETALADKQDTISDLATIRSGAEAGATAVQPSDLAEVATTGRYTDLSGTPTIPSATSDLTNDSGFITMSDVPEQVQANWSESDSSKKSYIQNKPNLSVYAQSSDLSTVAFSGSYNDLSSKPDIPIIGTRTVQD